MDWNLVTLKPLRPTNNSWAKQTPHMKEIVRGNSGSYTWQPLTDLLDPDGKPYLILDMEGEYHILFWKAWFEPYGKWSGSDWYDTPPTERNARRSKHWPKRIWELDGVDYHPRQITDYVPPLERLLKDNKVKSYKSLANGLIAIRKRGMWEYYRYNTDSKRYYMTGSTQRLER